MDTATPNTLTMLPPDVAAYFPSDVSFVRYGVWGEGSCFFLSICAALNHKNYLHLPPAEQKRIGREYRCDFSKHITDERWNEFASQHGFDMTPSQARRVFCNSKKWANQAMITFVSQVLGLNILFIDTESSEIYCGVHGGSDEPMIVVLWVARAHFEPIGVARGLGKDSTAVQFVFDPIKDAPIVDHIVNKYQAQCKM